MTQPELERDPELLARLPLDRHAGPAHRLLKDRAGAMIERALDAGLQAVPATSRGVRWQAVASAAALLLVLTGSAFAALAPWLRAPQQTAALEARPVPAKKHVQSPAPARVEPGEPLSAAPEPRAVERARAVSSEPDDLLQAANRLRAQGRFAAAADVYKVVYEQHPGSTSAYVAEIARASLELEHLAEPRHARLLFSRALHEQPRGALDIEARQGLALALRDLGDAAAEARMLSELIAAHPDSPAAKRAQARVAELAKKPGSPQP